MAQHFVINLGGEGEIADVINQQGPWALDPNWRSSRQGKTLQELVKDGHDFLIAPNDRLPLPDNSVDRVYTDSVPIDVTTWLGPGVQSSEIRRILKSGGEWIRDGTLYYTKP
ncbi:MAG: class I SAM-dependent methyltransferase [Planctomycetia bacterium]|nr:class I SAM-dependent methyltransferase [Planctomycetia bacterium]